MDWSAADIPDQAGRTAVVTGATGGLGYATAAALAVAGAQVVIASRDAGKGRVALEALRRDAPAAEVRFALLDLAALASVRAFAQRMLEAGAPLDVLVNNAGIMAPSKRQTTPDGFERQFGVNYLGHFALTGLLLPLLQAGAGARVVDVSSLAHSAGRLDFADLQSERYSPMRAYGRSKAAMLMFAEAFQRRSLAAGWGVDAFAAHPGFAATDLVRAGEGGSKLAAKGIALVGPMLGQSAARGALPILYAATAPAAAPGGYTGPDGFMELKGAPKPAKVAAFIGDRDAQDRLWAESERLTGVRYG